MSTPTRSQGASGTHHSSSNNPAQVSAILAAPGKSRANHAGRVGSSKVYRTTRGF
ncbi:hypothetical protein JG688_00012250 [Phytophthora aleatoria]|uniref:Uncharacterized protein n=1 Tax=Phytophthora aleatoria TaxID=2496075 RepID=A0A8J5IYZ9_9STRA|nr:hypothetical protein JG688_00012250 [Phytophthora aleatoria]